MTRGEFEIEVWRGTEGPRKELRRGWIFNRYFGAWRPTSRTDWSVTHLPSGKALGHFRTLDTAQRWSDYLVGLPIAWARVRNGKTFRDKPLGYRMLRYKKRLWKSEGWST